MTTSTILSQAEHDIKIAKNKLIKKAKRYGISENFGQKEARAIGDKYPYWVRYDTPGLGDIILRFEEWCMNFNLSDLQ